MKNVFYGQICSENDGLDKINHFLAIGLLGSFNMLIYIMKGQKKVVLETYLVDDHVEQRPSAVCSVVDCKKNHHTFFPSLCVCPFALHLCSSYHKRDGIKFSTL